VVSDLPCHETESPRPDRTSSSAMRDND